MDKINLTQKLAQFTEHWKPKIVGELNGQQVKLVKFQGPFVWHHHDVEDELFFVVKGTMKMGVREDGIERGDIRLDRPCPSRSFRQARCRAYKLLCKAHDPIRPIGVSAVALRSPRQATREHLVDG